MSLWRPAEALFGSTFARDSFVSGVTQFSHPFVCR